MSITFVRGDLLLATTQAAGIGLSANGRMTVEPLYTALQDRYPAFVSDYHRRSRAGILAPGIVWLWRESQPWIMGLIIRETPQGPARLRNIEAALLYLANNWQTEGLTSLAVAHLGDDEDWPAVRHLLANYLGPLALPVTVFEEYSAGVAPYL